MYNASFFDLSQDIMCVLNFEGYILKANPAWKLVLGWPPDEVVNKHFTTYIHPEHLQKIIEKAKEANISGGTKYVEFKALHKNGEFRWISWSSKVDFSKKIKLGIARDITIQKIATEKLNNTVQRLKEKEKVLTHLFNSLTEGVLLQDRFGNIVKHNQSFFDIVGIKSSTLMKNKNDLLKFVPLDENLESLKTENFPSTRALKTGQIQKNIIMALKRESENLTWLSVTAVPLNLNHDTEFDHVLITFNDITEQKQIEKERTETRAKLVASAKMSSLGEMAGGIAHEINNPLSIIYGKSGQLIRKIEKGLSDPTILIQDISKIENMADRIAKIIKDLHAFTRNSDAEPMLENSLTQIINETFDLCSERFRKKSIELSFLCDEKIYLECKSTQISQIIMNLLNNALDAVENLNEKWVKLTVENIGNSVQISITDSGNGISKNILEKIMQPFFTTKELGKGTGLGLSISRGLIENHHGEFFYDENSINTCFKIVLPKKQLKIEKMTA